MSTRSDWERDLERLEGAMTEMKAAEKVLDDAKSAGGSGRYINKSVSHMGLAVFWLGAEIQNIKRCLASNEPERLDAEVTL